MIRMTRSLTAHPSRRFLFVVIWIASYAALGGASRPADAQARRAPVGLDGRLRSFEPNIGQTDPAVRFLTRGPDANFFFTPAEIVVTFPPPGPRSPDPTPGAPWSPHTKLGVARLRFVGANPSPRLDPGAALPGRIHYLLGDDPARWRPGIPTFRDITYSDLYAGVDLTWVGTEGAVKGTYTVAPGSDPSRIRWRYHGAEAVELDPAGDLHVRVEGSSGDGAIASPAAGIVIERAPVAWQEVGGERRMVRVRYEIAGDGTIGFRLGDYDRAHPLTIDPTLTYSTHLGGGGDDYCTDVALDSAGNIYLTGTTTSLDFPPGGTVQPALAGGFDAWVAKLSPDGSELVYATYLGGAVLAPGAAFNQDLGDGIAVDAAGSAYVGGQTNSSDFPTMNPIQPANAGGYADAFVAKLSPDGGALVYSTYLGGTYASADYATDIAVDALGNAYVVGVAGSQNFPTVNPIQSHRGGPEDVFVCKLNPAGSALVYSTPIGGGAGDYASSMALDAAGAVYFVGTTGSLDYPVINPVPGVGSPGIFADVIVSKLNPSGSMLEYSTYLGGADHDFGYGIAIDSAGYAYVTGSTISNNFPTVTPFQPTLAGGSDAFVSKISPVGLALLYSTYLGGTNHDVGLAMAVDDAGIFTVTGRASSSDFPTADPIQSTLAGGTDVFLTQFAPAGGDLVQSTFLGGAGNDEGTSVILDGAGGILVAGYTRSAFPTANPLQPAYGGGSADGFLARISATAADLSVTQTDSPDPAVVSRPLTYTVTITNHGPDAAVGISVTDSLPGSATYESATPDQGSCSEAGGIVTCDLGSLGADATATVEISVTPTAEGTVRNVASARSATADPNLANGTDVEETTVEGSPTAVAEQDPAHSLAIRPLGPIPARGALGVSFTLPRSAPATLTLADVSGRALVARQVGALGAGRHVVDLGGDLAPGLYLIQLRQGREARSLKVVVIR